MPSIKFRHLLERQKIERGITEIESQLPQFRRETIEEFFQYLRQSPDGRGSRLTRLQAVYEHKWHLKKGLGSNKAQTAT